MLFARRESFILCAMKNILCLGLAPAIQRTLLFPAFEKGRVNRATECHVSPAGKSVNTGIALRRLGQSSVVAAFNGGMAGRVMSKLMKEWDTPACFTRTAGETRTCTTLIESNTGVETELVEEAKPASEAEVAAFVKGNLARLRKSSMLAISGTLAPWVSADFYAQFAALAMELNIPWVIDSHGRGLLAVLGMKPLIAKLNRDELRKTVPANSEDLLANARELMRLGAQNVFVTDGPRPATLVTPEAAWEIPAPDIDKVINPIGSGDCVTAGTIAGLFEGMSLLEAARLGQGCGSANAATHVPAFFDPAVARKLAKNTTPRPL